MQRTLEVVGGGHGIARAAEHGEHTVTLAPALDDQATMTFNAGADQIVVAHQRQPHCLGLALPQRGAPLDISEEERDRPGR